MALIVIVLDIIIVVSIYVVNPNSSLVVFAFHSYGPNEMDYTLSLKFFIIQN